MTRKKKTVVEEKPITEKAQLYLDLWLDLSKKHYEEEYDEIRKQMNALYRLMDKKDKLDFQRESERIEKKKNSH